MKCKVVKHVQKRFSFIRRAKNYGKINKTDEIKAVKVYYMEDRSTLKNDFTFGFSDGNFILNAITRVKRQSVNWYVFHF